MQSRDAETTSQMQTLISNNQETTARVLCLIEEQQGIHRRTSWFLRAGLLVSLLVTLLLIYLVYIIGNGTESMPLGMQSESDRMQRMEKSFVVMTENLEEIQAAMLSINGYMQGIHLDIRKLHEIRSPLSSIDANMLKLSNSLGLIESGISSLDRNTGELNSTMGVVANQLGQMTHDVNRMSKPRMMFPFD